MLSGPRITVLNFHPVLHLHLRINFLLGKELLKLYYCTF